MQPETVPADTVYASKADRDHVRRRGIAACIPSKAQPGCSSKPKGVCVAMLESPQPSPTGERRPPRFTQRYGSPGGARMAFALNTNRNHSPTVAAPADPLLFVRGAASDSSMSKDQG